MDYIYNFCFLKNFGGYSLLAPFCPPVLEMVVDFLFDYGSWDAKAHKKVMLAMVVDFLFDYGSWDAKAHKKVSRTLILQHIQ